MDVERRQQLYGELAVRPLDEPPADPADCEHRVITTWIVAPGYPDEGSVAAWSCADCRIRFRPEQLT
jgi:hypothetical protein